MLIPNDDWNFQKIWRNLWSRPFTQILMKSQNIKIVFVGESGTGKTSIITRYARGLFPEDTSSTVGAAYFPKTYMKDGVEFEMSLWDTAGQELYRSLTPMYIRNATAAIVTYDITSMKSFEALDQWIKEIQNNVSEVILIICGNKVDIETKRVVTTEMGEKMASSYQAMFIETSALTNTNIDLLFDKLMGQILMKPQFQIIIANQPRKIGIEGINSSSSCC